MQIGLKESVLCRLLWQEKTYPPRPSSQVLAQSLETMVTRYPLSSKSHDVVSPVTPPPITSMCGASRDGTERGVGSTEMSIPSTKLWPMSLDAIVVRYGELDVEEADYGNQRHLISCNPRDRQVLGRVTLRMAGSSRLSVDEVLPNRRMRLVVSPGTILHTTPHLPYTISRN